MSDSSAFWRVTFMEEARDGPAESTTDAPARAKRAQYEADTASLDCCHSWRGQAIPRAECGARLEQHRNHRDRDPGWQTVDHGIGLVRVRANRCVRRRECRRPAVQAVLLQRRRTRRRVG